jgi:predicted short-subunit dehydrogenase-like oxidoreductase (DUF2520 family)
MALAVLLERARHRVVAASGSDATRERVRRYLKFTTFVPAEEAVRAARQGKVVVIGVPDDQIADVCAELATDRAFRPAQHVLHLSGSVGLDALRPAAEAGAGVLSLQTFPDIESGISHLPGSPIAVTARTADAQEFGERLAMDVGGKPFMLADEAKPLYHAAAVFCSNYLVVVESVAEHLFRMAGMPDPITLFSPLARSTLEATLTRGPGEALTGPAARGDVGTIERNLEALDAHAPEARAAYVALARMAAEMALDAGRLTEEGRKQVEEVLDRWT